MENTYNNQSNESSKTQTPRDVFLYLLNVIVLAFVATNLGVLLYQFVNIYIPDVLQDRYNYPGMYDGAIRWAVAVLVIVFPVFVWVTRFLQKDISANPEKKSLRVRRWLMYLTLFVAGLVIIGDLVALVFSFLEGELTLRFFAKVLVVFGITGSIFYYYLNDLREKNSASRSLLAKVVVGIVVVAVVAGLFMAGLPQSRRLERIDEQRVSDLMGIHQNIINYWQAKRQLPASLEYLKDDTAGISVPVDPQTMQEYEYSAISPLKFSLCATFETDNTKTGQEVYPAYPNENWSHKAGRFCFERTIDPAYYPPLEKSIYR